MPLHKLAKSLLQKGNNTIGNCFDGDKSLHGESSVQDKSQQCCSSTPRNTSLRPSQTEFDAELQPYEYIIPFYKETSIEFNEKKASVKLNHSGNVSFTRPLGRGHALRLMGSTRNGLSVWFTRCTPEQIADNPCHKNNPPCSPSTCGNTCILGDRPYLIHGRNKEIYTFIRTGYGVEVRVDSCNFVITQNPTLEIIPMEIQAVDPLSVIVHLDHLACQKVSIIPDSNWMLRQVIGQRKEIMQLKMAHALLEQKVDLIANSVAALQADQANASHEVITSDPVNKFTSAS